MENFDGKLLLSTDEAAKALGVCTKTLWSRTFPRGPIPSVKIGSRVLYSPGDLRNWIYSQKNDLCEPFELATITSFEPGATVARGFVYLLDHGDVIEISVTPENVKSFENFQAAVKTETGLTLRKPQGDWQAIVEAAKGGEI